MAQRHEPPDSLDFFPTPPWAVRALLAKLDAMDEPMHLQVACDPMAGEGDIVRTLPDRFDRVIGRDVFDYSATWRAGHICDLGVEDFLLNGRRSSDDDAPDWIISNPPFRLATECVHAAYAQARRGFAFLLRTAWFEGQERADTIFSERPPTHAFHFASRVVMHKGRLRRPGIVYFCPHDGKDKTASTATAYTWVIWRFADVANDGMYRGGWISEARATFERPGDYPPLPPSEVPFRMPARDASSGRAAPQAVLI
ncbi:hypothetical protein [Shimia ponticola]|uniref:hypothetical protein n=1 Tax=Shimia ponticola TaxID=2582893 RepID=UPI0011BF0916|nr:hypothetical protein [Shimia ponticola]